MQLPRTREWREALGLTQRELAERAGVGEVTVPRIEAGSATTPRTARKIAEALGVSVADLMENPPVPLGPSVRREDAAFVILGRVVDGEYRTVVFWNVLEEEERERYRRQLEDSGMRGGYLEAEYSEENLSNFTGLSEERAREFLAAVA